MNRLNHARFLRLIAMRGCSALLACLALLLGPSVAAQRPNFLLILTDDHGYGDVSTYHASDVRTPNIDRIGAEGMLFTTMRANCTVCSPSRAALLTGRYADRVGVPGVIRTQPEDSWGYNLKTDPQETNNLALTSRQVFNELAAALRRYIQRGGATPWQKP